MDSDERRVVTAFLRYEGRVCLLRRSAAVGTYAGHWGGVSGYAEGDPDTQVHHEIAEETGLEDAVTFVRSASPITVEDAGHRWIVHPYLFDCSRDDVRLSEEHDAVEWIHPTEILTANRRTVPHLWEAYERVAETVRSVAADADHGASYLSIRALEVLRDRAGLLLSERSNDEQSTDEEWSELAELANRLLEARPAMAVLSNRINRAMSAAADGGDADAVHRRTRDGIDHGVSADRRCSQLASDNLDGMVLTLSRSDTVVDALRSAPLERVFIAESRPATEGRGVAESLANDHAVTLHADAAIAHVIDRESIDAVVFGADTILPDGRVINKVGSRAAAITAAFDGIPVYVIASRDKISPTETVNLESGTRTEIYDGTASIDVRNPTFDITPPSCITAFLTDGGPLDVDDVTAMAADHQKLATWRK